MNKRQIDIRAILADEVQRTELLALAVDFICKVEGVRREREPRSLLFNSRDGQPDPQYFAGLERFGL